MKINLKRTKNNPGEAWLLIIVGIVLCSFLLYGVLSQTLDKSAGFIIGGFLIFALCILVGILKLLNIKSVEYVNITGWKYRLFQKVTKWPFIFISGLIKTLEISLILFLLYFFNFLPAESLKSLTAKDILILVVFFFFMILISGYPIYKKYNSTDMKSSFTGIK